MKIRYWPLFISATIFVTASSALASRCDEKEPTFTRQALIRILSRDRLSIPIDKRGELKRVGNIRVNERTCLSFYTYELEFSSAPGTNPHTIARLLVIKNSRYIGMYIIDQPPILLNGNTILFFGEEKWGNKLIFDKEDPPKQIHLDGEFRDLVK
jgi:hypothetical protein